MNRDELVTIANELAQKHWGIPFDGEFELVNRYWKRMNACFVFNGTSGFKLIRMSKKVNDERTREEVIGTLLHELCHWYVYSQGLPASDIDDEFIAECIRVGAPISKATGAQRAYEKYMEKKEAAQ